MTPEKPHPQASASLTSAMPTLRCLNIRFSVSKPSRSSQTCRNGSQNAQMSSRSFGGRSDAAANPEIIGMHACTRSALVKHHQLLAFLESPQRRGKRSDIHRLRRYVEEMREQAADLAIEHTNELTALGHLDAKELLHREAEARS